MSYPGVVFVRPPNLQKSEQWKKQGVTRCPLNISLLASYAREKGDYTCSLVDFETIPAETSMEMAEIILRDDPKYVALTTLTPRFPTTVRISQAIKKLNPAVVTIIGGPHVTGCPEASLHESVDYCIIGEGEEALLELLNTLEEGKDPCHIRNLMYQTTTGTLVYNESRSLIKNLDELPLPAWDLMNFDKYTDPACFEGSHLAIFSSRGCPHACIFCASVVTWKRKLRFRSVGTVMKELRYISNILNIKNIMFWDDSFAANKKRGLAICNAMIEESLQMKYIVQIRADQVDEELVYALKCSGCQFAAIGVESGNQEILDMIGKKETKDQFRQAIKIMQQAGLKSIASYILGHPGDTHDTIKETIDFAFELEADQSKFMILCAYPGTKIFEAAKERGLVDPHNYEQMEATNYYDSVSLNLSNVSDEDLIKYQDVAYERFEQSRRP